MATTTGPDLTAGRQAVERLMDDVCTITNNPNGVDDATLDQTTGLLTDTTAAVYRGKCKIGTTASIGDAVKEQGGQQFTSRPYQLGIPISGPALAKGMVVKITSSRRDPGLVGKEFIIQNVIYSTFAISRKAICELRS